jgi:hypothetical protein
MDWLFSLSIGCFLYGFEGLNDVLKQILSFDEGIESFKPLKNNLQWPLNPKIDPRGWSI